MLTAHFVAINVIFNFIEQFFLTLLF